MPKPNRPNHPNRPIRPIRPNRKVFNDRIDVEEYIPDDVPYHSQNDDVIQMLSKQPFNFNGPNVRENLILCYFFIGLDDFQKKHLPISVSIVIFI